MLILIQQQLHSLFGIDMKQLCQTNSVITVSSLFSSLPSSLSISLCTSFSLTLTHTHTHTHTHSLSLSLSLSLFLLLSLSLLFAPSPISSQSIFTGEGRRVKTQQRQGSQQIRLSLLILTVKVPSIMWIFQTLLVTQPLYMRHRVIKTIVHLSIFQVHRKLGISKTVVFKIF